MIRTTDYKRFEDETDEELIYRITGEKDKIGSWQDVADILNELLGTEYTESKFRKQRQAFDKLLNANRSQFVDNDTQLAEINKQIEELRKERIKLQTANIERSRVDRAVSRQELYYEYIGNAIQTLPLPDFKPLNNNKNDSLTYYVVGLADVHYGAAFESVNNSYSPEIARKRFEELCDNLVDFVIKKELQNIKVVSLGDLIQGALRLNDLKINDSTVVKAIVEVSRLIAMLLNHLSQYVTIDYYHVPIANHTELRVLGAKAGELAGEDFEYLIGQYIKDLCSINDRINVHIAKEDEGFIEIDIPCVKVIAMHGHQIHNFENAVKDISMLHHKFYDAVIVGHIHNGREIPSTEGILSNGELLCCPSFVGSDPYSDKIYKGCKASVKIFGFKEYLGHTETYNIILN